MLCLIWASLMPLRTWPRFGPVVPLVPAAARVWQAPQAVAPVCVLPATKSCLAWAAGTGAAACWPPDGAGLAPAVIFWTQASKRSAATTCAVWRM